MHMWVNTLVIAPMTPPAPPTHRPTADASADVDVQDFDCVVAVAEPVPGWDLRLYVAVGVGRPGTEGVAADVRGRPVERPVLPRIGALRRLELRRLPFAFARETHV